MGPLVRAKPGSQRPRASQSGRPRCDGAERGRHHRTNLCGPAGAADPVGYQPGHGAIAGASPATGARPSACGLQLATADDPGAGGIRQRAATGAAITLADRQTTPHFALAAGPGSRRRVTCCRHRLAGPATALGACQPALATAGAAPRHCPRRPHTGRQRPQPPRPACGIFAASEPQRQRGQPADQQPGLQPAYALGAGWQPAGPAAQWWPSACTARCRYRAARSGRLRLPRYRAQRLC